jgi:hypothetical protein
VGSRLAGCASRSPGIREYGPELPVETVDAHPRHGACRAPFGARPTALPAHTAITRHMGLPWLAGLEVAYSGLARLPGERLPLACGSWVRNPGRASRARTRRHMDYSGLFPARA